MPVELHEKVLGQLKERYVEQVFPNVKDLKKEKQELLIHRKEVAEVEKKIRNKHEQIRELLCLV